ncbi:Acyl transferase/acyl hydrolase/lysophospholipase [Penicillium malachiteum]|uniref:Acyl transferase/acyl hydrolase/lysophospholipase n=1 Tax=Penicillium malachiteum TaxID=1324776 RepID=A0AAD6HK89_9EURO|nr:Acyl transferase/acyl hydrolase/lysophospholipase [Penicillium malachiteum]
MDSQYLPGQPGAPEPIAVIGMSCRFSGEASSVESFWEMLKAGRRGHSRVPSSRYEASAWHHPSHERKGAINHDSGFFLQEDPSLFDAPFFSITAKEAAGMDPVQRLLLEVAYETFENGGVPMEALPGSSTAVFSGCMTNDYELLSTNDILDMPHNAATGNGRTMLANRLSWFFDLRGPSIMMDTACSSSLTALHLAVQALRGGECEQALVTGASLILHPNFTQRLSYMHMLSADGVSHSFDRKANGYGRGEGLGAILLKPLSAAIRDKDAIRAVVRATGINQDGRTPGITMPSRVAQADLINEIYKNSNLSMLETGYFEAHGTGTGIGLSQKDPTELGAIGDSFGVNRSSEDPRLHVGSVKSNIGHTEGAAGIASVIKTILCLENDMFVPTAGLSQVNPKIELDQWKLALTNATCPWPDDLPRRASINSFGFGGSNAHAILESASSFLNSNNKIQSTPDKGSTAQLVVFSTYDKLGLTRLASTWSPPSAPDLYAKRDEKLQNIAYTMSERRSKLPFRSFAVASSFAELQGKLDSDLPAFERVSRSSSANLAFIFTGQGAQWAGMGISMLKFAQFADSLAQSQAILTSLGCSWDIIEELSADAKSSQLSIPDRSQAICCALQIGLVDLLKYWKVQPKAVVGHSSGEIGAAYAAGFLSREDAIQIAYFRGVVSLQGRRGAMMAVGLSPDGVAQYLASVPNESVVIACVNSPTSVTLSGDEDQIGHLEELLKSAGHFARKLRVEKAYHSPHMQDVADEYKEKLQHITPVLDHGSEVKMVSSVTKEVVSAADLTADYWVRNMVSSVEFSGAVATLSKLTDGRKMRRRVTTVKWTGFLEIGPHEALKGPFVQSLQAEMKTSTTPPYHALVQRNTDSIQTALSAAGNLWCLGSAIDIQAVNASLDPSPRTMVSHLPPYPWNHQTSFWHQSRASAALRQQKEPRHDLLGSGTDDKNAAEPRWRNFLRVAEIPWLADHVVAGSIVLPAAGMIAMVAEAARQMADSRRVLKGIEFNDLSFKRGVVIPDDDRGLETSVHIAPLPGAPERWQFSIFSLPETGPWIQHATGNMAIHYEENFPFSAADWDEFLETFQETEKTSSGREIESVYTWLSETGGVTLGAPFRSITSVSFCEDTSRLWASGQVTDTKSAMPYEMESPCFVHPTTLDALFQAAVLSCSNAASNQNAVIPTYVEKLFLPTDWKSQPGEKFMLHVQSTKRSGAMCKDSIAIRPGHLQPGIVLQGIQLGQVPRGGFSSKDTLKETQERFSKLSWSEAFLPSTSLLPHFPSDDKELVDWIECLAFTHGDGRVLVVIEAVNHASIMGVLQKIASPSIVGLNLQKLSMIIVGDETISSSDVQSLTELIPGTEIRHIKNIEEVQLEAIRDSVYDLAIVDIVQLGGVLRTSEVLSSVQKLLDSEGLLALRHSGSLPDLSNEIEMTSDWALRGVTGSGDYILASPRRTPTPFKETVYLLSDTSDQCSLALTFSEMLTSVNIHSQIINLREVRELDNSICVSFLEAERPWLADWDEESILNFKELSSKSKFILWVSPIPSSVKEASDAGAFGATTGLLRTLRNEAFNLILPQVQFPAADLLNTESGARSLAQGILRIFEITLNPPVTRPRDFEYRLEGMKVLVPRVLPATPINDAMNVAIHGSQPEPSQLTEDSRTLHYHAKDLGYWDEDPSKQARIPADHVEVEVKFQSIAGPKATTAPEANSSILQATGIIRQVGQDVTSGLSEGDMVMLMIPGDGTVSGLSTRFHVPFAAVARIPTGPGLKPTDAANIPLPYTLAFISLFQTAHLKTGSRILILGDLNQTFSALIHYSLEFPWIQVFVAIQDETEASKIQTQFLIRPEHILKINDGLDSRASALTSGHGFDIIVSCLGGSVPRQASRCLALGGHYVDLSSNMDITSIPAKLFAEGRIFSSVNLESMFKSAPLKVYSSFQRAIASLKSQIATVDSITFPASQIPDAEKQVAQSPLRVTIDLTCSEPVLIVPHAPQVINLSSNITFIVAGGLGTLGLALAETLVNRGVCHLVLLSRTGFVRDTHQLVIDRLKSRGCQVELVKCNIAKEEDVYQVLDRARSEGWQIKGIVQCATVLKDGMFENMTHQEWVTSTEPKMKGTSNLHKVFSGENLDYFITLSSVASIIGNMGQANYSAGNSYMDELMQWRRVHGLAAQSINIGLVPDGSGAGDLVESVEERTRRYSHLNGTEISLHEVQLLFDRVLQKQVSIPAQLNAGMTDDLSRDSPALWVHDRKFDHRIGFTELEASAGAVKTSQLMKEASSIEEATSAVTQALQAYLANSLSTSSDSIDLDMPLSAFGVDSLRATEVQSWIHREMGSQISSFELLGSQPLKRLSEKIVQESTAIAVR